MDKDVCNYLEDESLSMANEGSANRSFFPKVNVKWYNIKDAIIPIILCLVVIAISFFYSNSILPSWPGIEKYSQPETNVALSSPIFGIHKLPFLPFSDKDKIVSSTGIFGDSFGALNATFSGLAFALLIWTIILQQKDNRNAREEMKRQHDEMILNNLETTFFGLMDMQTKIVQSMVIRLKDKREFPNFWSVKNSIYQGDEVISKLLSELLDNLKGVNDLSDFVEIYKRFYIRYDNCLSRYHKHLYQIIKFVDGYKKSESSKSEIERYPKFIRAQLSSDEVVFLALHCLSSYGNGTFKDFVNKHHLLEHLPQNVSLDGYLCLFALHDQSAYGDNNSLIKRLIPHGLQSKSAEVG